MRCPEIMAEFLKAGQGGLYGAVLASDGNYFQGDNTDTVSSLIN
jgi:hypothetical protein